MKLRMVQASHMACTTTLKRFWKAASQSNDQNVRIDSQVMMFQRDIS